MTDRTVEHESLRVGAKAYIEQCDYFLRVIFPTTKGWSESRRIEETDLLTGLVTERGLTSVPAMIPMRWQARKATPGLTEATILMNHLLTTPEAVINKNRLVKMGGTVKKKHPRAVLFNIGAGYEPAWGTAFGQDVILVDPLYKTNRNMINEREGYLHIPENFSMRILDRAADRSIAIALNNSVHHFDDPQAVLAEIFADPRVVSITMADYDFGSLGENVEFKLRELQTLFSSTTERAEIAEMGVAGFVRLHKLAMYQSVSDLAEEHRFKEEEGTTFYPKLDPIVDEDSNLTEPEQNLLRRGDKFAVTYYR